MGTQSGRDEVEIGRFLERFALDMVNAGMPRMAARVLIAILIADDGRRTASELAAMLQVSPAAVSGAVRYLQQVEMITRVREPGERRDQYRITNDVWYETLLNRDRLLAEWAQRFGEGEKLLGPQTRAGERLGEMREFMQFMERELPALMDRWRATRSR